MCNKFSEHFPTVTDTFYPNLGKQRFRSAFDIYIESVFLNHMTCFQNFFLKLHYIPLQ